MAANLDRLVELAYSAIAEDSLWRAWTFELVQQFQAPGALFWVIDNNRVDMCQNHMCFRDADNAELAAEYLAEPVSYDPQMRRVCSSRRNEIYLDTDHVDEDDPRTSEYLKWHEARTGTRHHLTASIKLTESLEAGVSLHFSREQGPADAETLKKFNSIYPDFARALRLGFQHAEAVQESWWDGLAGVSGEARVLIGGLRQVLAMSDPAKQLIDRNDGISVENGRLSCLDSSAESLLNRALDLACRQEGAKGSTFAVRRTAGRPGYVLSVHPLPQRRRFLSPYGAAALVCIADRAAKFEGLSQEQRTALRLTPREGELAGLLMNGHSVASAAEHMGISYNTARVHLQSLLQHVNVSRQSELVLFLQRLR